MPDSKITDTAVCPHLTHPEYFRFGETILYKCDLCGLVFTSKLWEEADAKDLYKDYYKKEMAGRFNPVVEYIVKIFRFFRAFKIFTVYPGAKTILDIGSGRGLMLYYLRKYYKYSRTAGTQISKNAFEFSRYKLGLEIYDKDFLELPFDKNSFDVISLWHILEHVPMPEKYIERISEILDSNGKMVIEVPNFGSWSRRISGQYWLGLDFNYHIYFFTARSLSALLEKHRFKIKLVRTFSLEYSVFISAQSLVSRITKTDHLFFRGLQASGFGWLIAIHLPLFILMVPICFLVNIFLYFTKYGEVLFIVAEKNTANP